MGSARRGVVVLSAVLALTITALVGLSAMAGATTQAKKPSSTTTTTRALAVPKLALLAHRTFWECPKATTSVLVDVSSLTLHPGQTLSISFIVRNQAATACSYVAPYAGAAPGPTTTSLQVGPCGSMSYVVYGAHHRNVYPGLEVFNCPALGPGQLAPSATVEGGGTWSQTGSSGSGRLAPGNYTLVVDGHFTFPLHLAAH
jgi:hypothetical protein